MKKYLVMVMCLLMLLAISSTGAFAQEVFCDSSAQDCRNPLIKLIRDEKVGIDWSFWTIKDGWYINEIIAKFKSGVPVRIIMDPRAASNTPITGTYIAQLAAAGIPMRKRIAGDICHWKLMVFAGQGVVEWSGANYSSIAFVPDAPYENYEDEVLYFTHGLVGSFMTMYDNIWMNQLEYATYANVTTLARSYPVFAIDKRLNFPPKDSYQSRLVPLIDREPTGGLIDVNMFRLTMDKPVDAIIRAASRGVRVRMYLEPAEYSNPARPGNKIQIDKLVAAATLYPGTIEIRMRNHMGLNHQKTIWFHTQHIVVFGTSNWSDASDDNQLEANIFTDSDPADGLNSLIFSSLHEIFLRKWNNANPLGALETIAFRTPTLPPPSLGVCSDPAAINYGGSAPCTYPVKPPAPTTCTDSTATNYGGSLPCTYSPGNACTVTLDKTSYYAGSGTTGVAATWYINASGTCAWMARSDVDWLEVKNLLGQYVHNTDVQFTGNVSLKVHALANSGSKRTGHFVINGLVYTVTQGSGL